jgi:hypothetical protein
LYLLKEEHRSSEVQKFRSSGVQENLESWTSFYITLKSLQDFLGDSGC